MPKRKLVENKEVTPEVAALIGINYVDKKNIEKQLKGEIKELRVPLESFMDTHQKELAGGSKICVLTHAGTEINLKRTLKTSKELVPEADTILKAEGLNDCLETVTLVREDRIDAMYNAGKITDEQLRRLYKPVSSYAFSVTLSKKSEIPEV